MRRYSLALVFLFLAGLYSAGCGTPPNLLTVYTSPKDATVYLDDNPIGSGVAKYKLTFVKAGADYKPMTVYAKAPNHVDSKKVEVDFNPKGGEDAVYLALDGIANVHVSSDSASLTAKMEGQTATGAIDNTNVTLKGIVFQRAGDFSSPDSAPDYQPVNLEVSGAGYKTKTVPVAFSTSGEVVVPKLTLDPITMVPTTDCYLERREYVNPFFDLKTDTVWAMLQSGGDDAVVVTASGSKMPYFGLTPASIDGKGFIIYSVLHNTVVGDKPALAAHLEEVSTDDGGVTLIGDPSTKSGAEIYIMPCWDPNKRRVYFSRSHLSEVFTPFSIDSASLDDVIVQKEKGGPTTSYLWPDIKPAGGKQVVYSFCDSGDQRKLGREDIDKPSQQSLITYADQPKFAPNGNTIAYIKRNYSDTSGRQTPWDYDKKIDGDDFTAKFFPSSLCLFKNNKFSQIFPQDTDPRAAKTEVKDVAWVDDDHVVFASNYETVNDQKPNFDIYYMDVSKGTAPQRLTHNASVDDYPVVLGDYVYFRSNRRGMWNIWRIHKPTN
ncbi:MAG: TolB family protein [Planctomycetota bacterium]